MKSVYDLILDNYYRIVHTVPLCEEAAEKFPHNRDFWLEAAEQERGHDDILLNELVESFGQSILEDLENYVPPITIVQLLAWVNKEEINHLVYKAFLESAAVSEAYAPSRNFYRQYMPKFIALHEKEDEAHSKTVLEMLKGIDISKQLKIIQGYII